MLVTIALTGAQLHTLLRPVMPHAPRGDEVLPSGVPLESDGRYIYAAASDRYTLGVARLELQEPTTPYAAVVRPPDVRTVLKAIRPRDERVTLTLHDAGASVLHTPVGGEPTTYALAAVETSPSERWRSMLAWAVHQERSGCEEVHLNPRYLARFHRAPHPLVMQTKRRMVLITSLDGTFVGGIARVVVADTDPAPAPLLGGDPPGPPDGPGRLATNPRPHYGAGV